MNNLHRCFHFHHGDHGYYAEREYGDIEWDKEKNVEEPTEAEIEAAYEWWQNDGWNAALIEEEWDRGDWEYEKSRD